MGNDSPKPQHKRSASVDVSAFSDPKSNDGLFNDPELLSKLVFEDYDCLKNMHKELIKKTCTKLYEIAFENFIAISMISREYTSQTSSVLQGRGLYPFGVGSRSASPKEGWDALRERGADQGASPKIFLRNAFLDIFQLWTRCA